MELHHPGWVCRGLSAQSKVQDRVLELGGSLEVQESKPSQQRDRQPVPG